MERESPVDGDRRRRSGQAEEVISREFPRHAVEDVPSTAQPAATCWSRRVTDGPHSRRGGLLDGTLRQCSSRSPGGARTGGAQPSGGGSATVRGTSTSTLMLSRASAADPDGRTITISCGACRAFTLRIAANWPQLGDLVHPAVPRPLHGLRWWPGCRDESALLRICERDTFAAVTARHRPRRVGLVSLLADEFRAAREGSQGRRDGCALAGGRRSASRAGRGGSGGRARAAAGCKWRPNRRMGCLTGSTRRDGIPPAAYPAGSAPPPPGWPRPCTVSRSSCRSCATSSGSSWRRARTRR